MDRPPRNKKTVNYSDFLDDDDEDFAIVKAPPNKKARSSIKEPHQDVESPSNTAKDVIDIADKRHKKRVSLDEKLYKRDLEEALNLSLLQSTENTDEPFSSSVEEEKCQPPVLTHCSMDGSCLENYTSSIHPAYDSPPVLSNCSVDISCLGLDHITNEQTHLPASKQRKASKPKENQRRVLQDESEGDEEYKPQNTPESDVDFDDTDESENEEYTVKRKKEKNKTSRNEKKTAAKTVKKERNQPNFPKAKAKTAATKTVLSRSPGVGQSAPALRRSPITPPTPKLALCSSPTGGRLPKWNPPGLVGSSPTSCQNAPVKSPGLGLRLGLSRLARVKPLHPNSAAH